VDWAACPRWFAATGLTPWVKNITTQANVFTDGVTYTLDSRATDKTGNVQTALATLTFTYDTSRPTTAINNPKTLSG